MNSEKVTRILLAKGANPEAGNKYGQKALHVAALHNSFRTFRALILRGINPNQTDADRNTAMHHAITNVIRHGDYDIIKLLLRINARIDIHNIRGKSVNQLLSQPDFTEEAKNIYAIMRKIYLTDNRT